jgi:hypothetical protein
LRATVPSRSVLDAGRQVVGTDQSVGNACPREGEHPDVQLEHVGLQELAFEEEFGAAMCVDAMDTCRPRTGRASSDPAATSTSRSRRSTDESSIVCSPKRRKRASSPFMARMSAQIAASTTTTPDREHVRRWLVDAGFALVDEADEGFDGYSHHHLLVQTEEG